MTPERFARTEYRDLCVYRKLAAVETVPAFKRILEELVVHEQEDFDFWKGLSDRKEFSVSSFTLFLYVLIRKVFGLTFTALFLEGREKEAQAAYQKYLQTVTDPAIKQRVESIIEHEKYHERVLIDHIEEKRVKFVSSMVLGLNDGLIELTGALTGFAFALQNALLVALAGSITGISASMSMAASAYLQARHEENDKNPITAALFTGVSYLVVVILLIAPFLLIGSTLTALAVMLGIVVLIILSVSFYSSVLLERRFSLQFGEMLAFSLGVAVVAFFLGLGLRALIGVEI